MEGKTFYSSLRVTESLIARYVELSGDNHPFHTDDVYAKKCGFEGRIAHGNILGMFLSRWVGTEFPVPGVMLVSESLEFKTVLYPNTTANLVAEVEHYSESVGLVSLRLKFISDDGLVYATGKCALKVPV